MEGNPGLAKDFLKTQNAREKSRRQWEELAVRYSLGGTIKTYKQWTKVGIVMLETLNILQSSSGLGPLKNVRCTCLCFLKHVFSFVILT
jgi:hypothetical protein